MGALGDRRGSREERKEDKTIMQIQLVIRSPPKKFRDRILPHVNVFGANHPKGVEFGFHQLI